MKRHSYISQDRRVGKSRDTQKLAENYRRKLHKTRSENYRHNSAVIYPQRKIMPLAAIHLHTTHLLGLLYRYSPLSLRYQNRAGNNKNKSYYQKYYLAGPVCSRCSTGADSKRGILPYPGQCAGHSGDDTCHNQKAYSISDAVFINQTQNREQSTTKKHLRRQ